MIFSYELETGFYYEQILLEKKNIYIYIQH